MAEQYNPDKLEKLLKAIDNARKSNNQTQPAPRNKVNAQTEENFLFDRMIQREENQLKHDVFKFLVRLVVGFISVIIFCRVWHLVMPQCMCWMAKEQITYIDTAVISGLTGGIFGKFFNQIFKVAS